MKILIILVFLSIFITIIYLLSKNYIELYGSNKNIKILNLVLYSKEKSYDKMYEITRIYYSKFYPQVKTIYYLFDNSLTKPILKDDILFIPGKETYLPGILDKTIKAIEFTKNLDYDYLLRSNISTIVNLKGFLKFLNKNQNIDYGGSWLNNNIRKGYRDPLSGINDDRYDGLDYISGTGIVLSRKAVINLLENKNKIDYTVVDDVSIGTFFQNNTNIKPISFNSTVSYDEKDLNKESNDVDLNMIFYRNRRKNREDDVKNMKVILDLLSL
jgi:hypothetical protein